MTDKPLTILHCLIILCVIGVAVLLTVLIHDSMVPYEPIDPYCEMVSIWIESDGEYGWPDYRRTYEQDCPAIPLE